MLRLKILALCVMLSLLCCGKGVAGETQNEPDVFQKRVQSPVPLIWDDDGSPDGIISLLYFLRHPGIDVRAVTVSCGLAHPDIFARNLKRMLSGLGITDIPVAGGSSLPLAGNNAFPETWRQSADAFWQIQLPELEAEPVTLSAAELIVDIVNRSQSPITIFVSGTHTNLAGALRLDPGISAKIRTIDSMGGALQVPGNVKRGAVRDHESVAEWNIWIDPLAASEVFKFGLPINLAPLDAAQKVTWKKSDAERWNSSNSPEGRLAASLLEWMLQAMSPHGVNIWDLVAAVNVTMPALCEQRPYHVRVVTKPGDQQGRTVIDYTASPNTNVCISPDENAIKEHVNIIFGQL